MEVEHLSPSILKDSPNGTIALAERPQLKLTTDYLFGPSKEGWGLSEQGKIFYGTLINFWLWQKESAKFKDGSKEKPEMSEDRLNEIRDDVGIRCKDIGIRSEDLEALGPQFLSIIEERKRYISENTH